MKGSDRDQNYLTLAPASSGVSSKNLTGPPSRIRDVGLAAYLTNHTKTQILSQAGLAMHAQANSSGESVDELLH
jgi:flagellin